MKNVIHQIDSKNGWLLLSASFTAKFGLVFLLALENAFSWTFHFKANRKSIDSSEKQTRDFQNSPPFERSPCFYVTIGGNIAQKMKFSIFSLFSMEMNVYTLNIKTTVTWHHDFYGCQGYKFTSSLKDSLPYSRIRVTTESLLLNIVLSISLILFRRVDRSA